jgi:hypothetical protein
LKKTLALGFAALCAVAAMGPAQAQFLLADMNSVVNVDPYSSAGMNAWLVDGVNQIRKQWYWFRVGTAAEQSIDTISAPVVTQFTPSAMQITYTNNLLKFDLTMMLTGGAPGSKTADVAETVRVTNLTGSALNFHVFEYDDFDLSGNGLDDNAVEINSSTIGQYDNSMQVSVGAVPVPGHWQIDVAPNLLASLNDATATTLADQTSPLGPTDCAFAFQWDKSIAAHSSMILSKDKLLEVSQVPEPGTMLAFAGAAAVFFRRKKG